MRLAHLVDVPSSIKIDGQVHVVIDTQRNFYYRALVLPRLGAPRWLSNDQVAEYTGQNPTERGWHDTA